MKIGSPVPHKKARIEIIPLIDIMFFLLAAFLLASLSMIKMESIKMDLPAAGTAKRDFQPDIVNVSIDKAGKIFVEKEQIELPALQSYLSNKYRMHTNVPVYISGDKETSHGYVTRVLDAVRRGGIQKVAFATSPVENKPAKP